MLELHTLPGRIRVKNHILYNDKALAQYIDVYCENLYGVRHCHVNGRTATILIVYDEEKTTRNLILDNLENAIYAALNKEREDLTAYEAYNEAIARKNKAKKWFLIYGITYVLFKIKQAMYGKFSLSRNIRVLEVAALVTIVGGYPLLKSFYKRFTKKLPADSDILLKLTAASLTILRESTKGVFVLILKELNDYIKYSADAECMRTLRQSMGVMSGMAYLLKDGQEVLVTANELRLNDTIVIRKGEIVSAEGEVIGGSAIVNSLYHTGQPLVEHIAEGNKAAEGMAVLSGEIKVRITRLSDIKEKVDITKSNISFYRDIKDYSKKITYISMGLAAINFLWTRSILGAMSILLVLSPSAASTAFSSGMKNYVALLNKNNIYIRNPNVFEKLVRVNHIVFDKTGTLTYGIMKICNVELYDTGYTAPELLKLCAACETDHYHPISVTLQNEAKGQCDINKVQSSVLLPSKGIVAQCDNQRVLIGNRRLMQEYDIDISMGLDSYTESEKQFCTPVFVVIENNLVGLISMKDIIRESAPEAIRRLNNRGITNITLLTGDNQDKAQQTAAGLGIKNVYSGCSMEDKVNVINQYKKDSTVMMIGDGINDISSMQAADISVSFVNSSCDKVKLHSDCIVFEDNMTSLADLISLSQKSYRRINQSIRASNAFNFFFGILALYPYFDPFTAKSINTINSLVVLLLNLRINYLSAGKIYPDEYDIEEDNQEEI